MIALFLYWLFLFYDSSLVLIVSILLIASCISFIFSITGVHRPSQMPAKRTTKRRFGPKSKKSKITIKRSDAFRTMSANGNKLGCKPKSCIRCIQKKTFCTKTIACERFVPGKVCASRLR